MVRGDNATPCSQARQAQESQSADEAPLSASPASREDSVNKHRRGGKCFTSAVRSVRLPKPGESLTQKGSRALRQQSTRGTRRSHSACQPPLPLRPPCYTALLSEPPSGATPPPPLHFPFPSHLSPLPSPFPSPLSVTPPPPLAPGFPRPRDGRGGEGRGGEG